MLKILLAISTTLCMHDLAVLYLCVLEITPITTMKHLTFLFLKEVKNTNERQNKNTTIC
jgi:hypothetical protein